MQNSWEIKSTEQTCGAQTKLSKLLCTASVEPFACVTSFTRSAKRDCQEPTHDTDRDAPSSCDMYVAAPYLVKLEGYFHQVAASASYS